MVKSHFKYSRPDILYKLFKTYCMPLYGCPLWDFSTKNIELFLVSWRKAIRYLFNLPHRTHCSLLHRICGDMPVLNQLYSRFVNFIKNIASNRNCLTQLCVKHVIKGSKSVVSNNVTVVSSRMSVSRDDLICLCKSDFYDHSSVPPEISVIQDMLYMRYTNMFNSSHNLLGRDEVDLIITTLCTS